MERALALASAPAVLAAYTAMVHWMGGDPLAPRALLAGLAAAISFTAVLLPGRSSIVWGPRIAAGAGVYLLTIDSIRGLAPVACMDNPMLPDPGMDCATALAAARALTILAPAFVATLAYGIHRFTRVPEREATPDASTSTL